jgi:UDP-glucuronate decarboxylase
MNIIEKDAVYIAKYDLPWELFRNCTFLISGASGLLASYIIQALMMLNNVKNYNIKIIALVRNSAKANKKFYNHLKNKNFTIIEMDICKQFIINEKIDYIIHAASNADPRHFFTDPVGTFKANCLGTINLLELAKKNQAEFLYFSSGEVYGDIFQRKEGAIFENDYGFVNIDEIRNCYAEGKRVGEMLCQSYLKQYGVNYKIVRPSHTYGPGFALDDSRAFANFTNSVLNDRDIVLNSDGKAMRSFLYIADATLAYFTIILKGEKGQAYNVGGEYEISIFDLASIIIKASGKDLKVKFSEGVFAASSAAKHGLLSVDKLKKLGWKPSTNEIEGFKKTIEYYKSKNL